MFMMSDVRNFMTYDNLVSFILIKEIIILAFCKLVLFSNIAYFKILFVSQTVGYYMIYGYYKFIEIIIA